MNSRLILSACTVLLLTACGEEAPPPEPVARPIKILELGGASGGGVLEFPGSVEAGQSAELAFEVPGKLIERPVDEGQLVEAGTLLARLDPRDYETELAAQEAQRAAAQAEFSRTRKLFNAEVTSRQELDAKRRTFEVSEARVEQAAKAVEDTRLLAPFAGTVARIVIENFENVQAKQTVLVLENDALFDVAVAIPEQDAARLEPGLSLAERTTRGRPTVEISALPGRSFPARISEFATTADPATRTFEATIQFENPGDVTIRSGMTAKVTVNVPDDVEAAAGTRIPSVATTADENGDAYLWVVDPTSLAVSRRNVVLGELSGDSVQVREGLAGQEWIATSGVHHLREGMVVRRAGE